jgi:hypothetical protein
MGFPGEIERWRGHVALLGARGVGKTLLAERLSSAARTRHLALLESREADPGLLADALAAVVVVDGLRGVDDGAAAALIRAAAKAGARHVIVAVNGMDRAGFEYEVFKSVRRDLAALGVAATPVPVSALFDFNVASPGEAMEWHPPRSLADHLLAAEAAHIRETVGA